VARSRGPRPRRRWAATAVVVASGLAASCGHTVNYLDPAGPVYRFRTEAREAPAPAAPFRVVSFNIEYSRKIGPALEALRTSPQLRDPDLLSLQEMDAPGVERIARELGMNAVYFPSGVHPTPKHDFGCALLSPWPLEDDSKLLLPHAAFGTRLRRATVAATVVRGGLRVRAFCVDLPSPMAVTGGSRREQAQTIIKDADRAIAAGLPVVVAGDFNSHGIGEQFTRAGYAWPTRDLGPTVRWTLFDLHYDHVFSRGLVPVTGQASAGVADNHEASDHHPIWVLLAPPATAQP